MTHGHETLPTRKAVGAVPDRWGKHSVRGQAKVHSKPVLFGALLLVAVAALHFLWLAFGWGGETQRIWLGNVLYVLPSFIAASLTLAAALKQRGAIRRGWLFIGLGLFAQAVGSGIFGYLELVPEIEPFPSAADFFFLAFGPLLAFGLAQLMPPPQNRLEGLRLGLDLAIAVSAVGLYFWYLLLAPSLAFGVDNWMTLVALAYPLLDLLLLSMLLFIMLGGGHKEPLRLELVLFGLGVATQIAADTLFNAATAAGTYYTGHPLDSLFSLSMMLYGLAAYTSLVKRQPVTHQVVTTLNGYVAVALPYLAVIAGFGLLLVSSNGSSRDTLGAKGVLYGSVAVTLLVIGRQLLAFRENWRLTGHLARQRGELRAFSETLEAKVKARTSELEALSTRYRHDALHDSLTRLPNRTHFRQNLRRTVESGRCFAVLYLDFDRFKTVNDSFGHAVGDALLVTIGMRLLSSVRPNDLVARLGGDEFAVLMEVTDAAEAERVAERLIGAFLGPLEVAGHTLHCTVSIGVVLGSGGRRGTENTLRDADIAMYRAKAAGRSRFVVFEASMREHLQARLGLETDLRGAVGKGELTVFYQPVLQSASGTVAGFEALLRWQHPARGLVFPGDFVPLAEETGLIVGIDRWVLRAACAQLSAWTPRNPELTVSVNLSSRQFARPDLAAFVAAVLAEFALAPQRLKLELTESLLVDGSPTVRETLAKLRQLGVGLHIDDFGTGYSSLSYLQRFDADSLKVDRSFVLQMVEHQGSAELVRTIVEMAHNLGLKVIAEGVESSEQYARLRALGCEYVQGFLFSEPVPAAAADEILTEQAAQRRLAQLTNGATRLS